MGVSLREVVMKKIILMLCILCFAGCETIDPYTNEKKTSNTTKGAGIGAITGAVIGAASSSKKNRGRGALTGALLGGAIGGGVGHYMDNQEKKLRERLQGTGVRVERDGDNLNLIMPGNITFASSRAEIRADFYDVLSSVALVLKEFDKTDIHIGGHTDSTGSDQINQKLSEDRANSVRVYLANQKIKSGRLHAVGYSSRQPIASNNTDEGRQANRRVELQLTPKEQ
jgi:outer membrane protein OmpA-like peptidoglycan-associated protein